MPYKLKKYIDYFLNIDKLYEDLIKMDIKLKFDNYDLILKNVTLKKDKIEIIMRYHDVIIKKLDSDSKHNLNKSGTILLKDGDIEYFNNKQYILKDNSNILCGNINYNVLGYNDEWLKGRVQDMSIINKNDYLQLWNNESKGVNNE